MGMSVTLDYGSVGTQSIADTYAGKDLLPPNLVDLKKNQVHCPKTGRHYRQTDYQRIFLIPVRD